MAVSEPAGRGSNIPKSSKGWSVHTSARHGRKYVDSNELINSEEAQRQIKQLRKWIRTRP